MKTQISKEVIDLFDATKHENINLLQAVYVADHKIAVLALDHSNSANYFMFVVDIDAGRVLSSKKYTNND
jgi:hypothetical protein